MSILQRCPLRESQLTVQTIPGQSILGGGLTNLVESRYVKKERALLLVDMHYLKTPLLKLPSVNWVSI